MKRFGSVFRWVIALSMMFCGSAEAAKSAKSGLPVIGGKKALALVNGEPVSVEEFRRALESLHESAGEKKPGGGRHYSELLQRLINGKLLLQEARNIGLDTLPEVRDAVKEYQQKTMRSILLVQQVRDIPLDERRAEKAYREAIREFRVRSFLFAKEEDANQALEEVRTGSDFDNVMMRMVTEGKARGNEEAGFVKGKDLLPEILESASKLGAGGVSPVLKVPSGKKGEAAYTILKVEDIRFPEDPEAKEQARREVGKEQRLEAIRKYVETLKKKYAKIHRETLDALDYEAKDPGMEKLLEDRRVLADIEGEEPIRVEELSRALQRKFYHGPQQAASSKKLNREIPELFDEIVNGRVLNKEAYRKKIDRSPDCRQRVKAYEEGILFGTFVEKAISPNIKVDEGAVRKYYEEHPVEFSSPEMIRGEDLAFAGREDAADALEKLRRGADFKWVKANAPGQVEGKERQRVFPPEGGYVSMADLVEGAREAVAGAGPEEYRFYAGPKGQSFVLYILDVAPPKPYPFESVQGKIEKKMYGVEMQKSVEEWAGKLRAASEIKVFASDREMEKIFAPAGGRGGKP